MDVIAKNHQAAVLWKDLLDRVQGLMKARGVHPADTVVLLPFAQLMPLARRLWAASKPDGFAPRFETSMNWAARLGGAASHDDISFERGRDLLTARTWLDRAGLGGRARMLAPNLVEAAWQAAGPASAVPPAHRAGWAATARGALSSGPDVPMLEVEAAVARIAAEWAAASRYTGDVLMEPATLQGVGLLVVCEGLQPDLLANALCGLLGERAVRLPLDRDAPRGEVKLHQAEDPSQEVELAAACVMRHLEAGRVPVALAAVDRVLTRRVRALLGVRGVAVRDETGWKLSTTRAAAQLMAGLRAAAWTASTDVVLDWLKNAPAVRSGAVLALERRVRRAGLRDWRDVEAGQIGGELGSWSELITQANAWRGAMQGSRPLTAWQPLLRELLEQTGQRNRLQADDAGAQVLQVLGLLPESRDDWMQLPQAASGLSLAEFTAWCTEVLEAESFVPQPPGQEQVVILPLHQLLGRPFEALVVAGCDEARLPASPDPPGHWTALQRAALGLPSRHVLEQVQRAGWASALRVPQVDVLWRRSDDGGEPVLSSPLVQGLRLQGAGTLAGDPREQKAVGPAPVARPLPRAAELPVRKLSASAYEDLRRCPYRFFALRQLGLQEASEIDVEVDKRDFGNWLHQVLRDFHRALQAEPDADRRALLDWCAKRTTDSMALGGGEFLPFEAGWPQVREGYLDWLQGHEAKGAKFEAAEGEHEVPLGELRLIGRIDRVDRLPDGRRFVIDYKTEALAKSTERVKSPGEDTQLAFYAALLEDDTLRAAYVNLSERGEVNTVEQRAVVEARDALVQGIRDDLARILGGAALPALGEGQVCDYCAARGLCRRDHWNG